MELKKISENDIEQVSQLYYSAFPEDERAPWKALIEKHNKGNFYQSMIKINGLG